jgi:hypothetical protein
VGASQFDPQAFQLQDGRTRVSGSQKFHPFTGQVEYRFLLVQDRVVVKGSGTGSDPSWSGTTFPGENRLQKGSALAVGLAFLVEDEQSPGFTTFTWSDQVEVVDQ